MPKCPQCLRDCRKWCGVRLGWGLAASRAAEDRVASGVHRVAVVLDRGMFCWILAGRRSRSAWLEVGGTRRSWAKRSTSSSRSRRTSNNSLALRCPGLVAWPVVSDSPTFTSSRKVLISVSRMASSTAWRPTSRARLAWWINSRSASAIWVDQYASR